MNDGKLPQCPHCAAAQTIRFGQTLTRTIYFCLACGKSFERRIDPQRASSADDEELRS